MTISWPSIKSTPDKDSWKRSPLLSPVRTDQITSGNIRQRPRPGDMVTIVTQTIIFSNADFATFETFVATTLYGGVAQFQMPVFLGDAYYTKTVQFEATGNDFPYQVQAVGPNYKSVSMMLRVFL